MLDILAFIALIIVLTGIVIGLYFYTQEQQRVIKKIQEDLLVFPVELQKFYMTVAAENNKQTQKVLGDSFGKFLKHIEKLERMTLPKPVTDKDVRSVMRRIGPVADEQFEQEQWKNEIEEAEKGVELPVNEWTGYIDANTKVAFEGEGAPTIVE